LTFDKVSQTLEHFFITADYVSLIRYNPLLNMFCPLSNI